MFKSTYCAVVASILTAAGAGTSFAASTISDMTGVKITNDDLPMIASGVQEFGLSGNLNWTNDTTYALDLSYGRFVTDCILAGVKGGVIGENSDADFSFGVFGEYNYKTGTKWVPFIGIGADWARLDDGFASSDAIRLRGELGVKYFLRSNMALSASMSGTWASDTLPGGDDFGKQINFGLRTYF